MSDLLVIVDEAPEGTLDIDEAIRNAGRILMIGSPEEANFVETVKNFISSTTES